MGWYLSDTSKALLLTITNMNNIDPVILHIQSITNWPWIQHLDAYEKYL